MLRSWAAPWTAYSKSRPGEDLEDAVQGRVRLGPVEADGQGAVRPRVPSRQRPEGGEDAVDTRVAVVPLVQRPLAGGIVDEGHPVLTQVLGEGDHRQDFCEDLQHVNVRPPGVELAYEPGWHRAGIIPRCAACPDDVAPSVGTPV